MIAYLLSYLIIFCFFDFYWQLLTVSLVSLVFCPKDERARVLVAIVIAFSLYAIILQPQLYQGEDKYRVDDGVYESVEPIRSYIGEHSNSLSENAKIAYNALIMGNMNYKSDFGKIVSSQGIFHLFVVSGFHFGILFLVLGFVLNKVFKLPYKLSLIVIAILATLYFMVLEGGYGAGRAYFMIILSILAFFMGRNSDSENALFLISLFWIIAFPNSLHKLGFQLTFVATYLLILSNKIDFIEKVDSKIVKDIVLLKQINLLKLIEGMLF